MGWERETKLDQRTRERNVNKWEKLNDRKWSVLGCVGKFHNNIININSWIMTWFKLNLTPDFSTVIFKNKLQCNFHCKQFVGFLNMDSVTIFYSFILHFKNW